MRDGWVKFKVSVSQNFWRRKACVINSIPKSTVYKNKWALQIFREWQGEPGEVFKGEDIGFDVQELTESIEN